MLFSLFRVALVAVKAVFVVAEFRQVTASRIASRIYIDGVVWWAEESAHHMDSLCTCGRLELLETYCVPGCAMAPNTLIVDMVVYTGCDGI